MAVIWRIIQSSVNYQLVSASRFSWSGLWGAIYQSSWALMGSPHFQLVYSAGWSTSDRGTCSSYKGTSAPLNRTCRAGLHANFDTISCTSEILTQAFILVAICMKEHRLGTTRRWRYRCNIYPTIEDTQLLYVSRLLHMVRHSRPSAWV